MFLRATKRFKDGKIHTWPSDEWKKPRAERRPELSFKDALFFFLFDSTCDVVLFDLTSTYFGS